MPRRLVLQLVFHGLLLLVCGLLVGVPFLGAILHHAGPDAERGWRVAHTSLVGLGALYLAVAGVAHTLSLAPGAAAFSAWALVFGAHASIFAFVVGPAIGARGLEPVGPPLHLVVFVVVSVAVLAVSAAAVVLLYGAYSSLRGARRES